MRLKTEVAINSILNNKMVEARRNPNYQDLRRIIDPRIADIMVDWNNGMLAIPQDYEYDGHMDEVVIRNPRNFRQRNRVGHRVPVQLIQVPFLPVDRL